MRTSRLLEKWFALMELRPRKPLLQKGFIAGVTSAPANADVLVVSTPSKDYGRE